MKELYDFLAKNDITPNGLYVLHCLNKNYSHANYVNTQTELYRLTMSQLVIKKVDDFGTKYVITTKGNHLLKEAEELLVVGKRAKKNEVPFADWEQKIIAYNEMFPKGKKAGSSVSFRTNPKELYEKFKWFFAENPDYTWELVMKATADYVKSFDESMEYTYMQTSKYFIKKEDKNRNVTSTLGSMCYNILEGNTEEVSDGYRFFGD